jgi:hypothetical protein
LITFEAFQSRAMGGSKFLMTVNNKMERNCKEQVTKVQGTLIPVHAMKSHRRSRGNAPLILNVSGNDQHDTPVALPTEKKPLCPLTRRLVCTFRKRKNYFVSTGLEARTVLHLRWYPGSPERSGRCFFKIGSRNFSEGTEEENEKPESE